MRIEPSGIDVQLLTVRDDLSYILYPGSIVRFLLCNREKEPPGMVPRPVEDVGERITCFLTLHAGPEDRSDIFVRSPRHENGPC